MSQHELRLFSPAGVEFARVSDFDWLTCTIRVNAPGFFQAGLRGDHSALNELENRGFVEYWRSDDAAGVDWYRHYSGLYLDQSRKLFKVPSAVMRAWGDYVMLNRRIVNYYAGYSGRSKFDSVKAETIGKELVKYNITSNATTANGRKRAGDSWPSSIISVETDAGGGITRSWNCHGDILMETLQDLALIAGGDFSLEKTGNNAFTFRFHAGQMGTDRRSTLQFAVNLDNMGDPEWGYNRAKEKTIGCVWGQGNAADRDYTTVIGDDYDSDNDQEVYIAATHIEKGDLDGLGDYGGQKMKELRAVQSFNFYALQGVNTVYHKDYYLGDLGIAVNPFTGEETDQKVEAIHLSLDDSGNEIIDTELRSL